MSVVHINFDTETLGLYENAVVTTLSAVPFTFEDNTPYDELVRQGFFVKFKIVEQLKVYGRETTQSTVDWWKQQSEEAKVFSIKPSADDVTLVEGLNSLTAFIKESGYDWKKSYLWSRGNAFDFPKIESLYRNCGLEVPFNTFRVRDTRTMIDCLTGSENGYYRLREGQPKSFVKHHALHDAALDCANLIEIYQTMANESAT